MTSIFPFDPQLIKIGFVFYIHWIQQKEDGFFQMSQRDRRCPAFSKTQRKLRSQTTSDSLMSALESIKSIMSEHNSSTSHWHMTKQTLNYELLTLLNESMFFQLKKCSISRIQFYESSVRIHCKCSHRRH